LHNIPGQKTSAAVLDTDALDLNKMFTILSILISRTAGQRIFGNNVSSARPVLTTGCSFTQQQHFGGIKTQTFQNRFSSQV